MVRAERPHAGEIREKLLAKNTFWRALRLRRLRRFCRRPPPTFQPDVLHKYRVREMLGDVSPSVLKFYFRSLKMDANDERTNSSPGLESDELSLSRSSGSH